MVPAMRVRRAVGSAGGPSARRGGGHGAERAGVGDHRQAQPGRRTAGGPAHRGAGDHEERGGGAGAACGLPAPACVARRSRSPRRRRRARPRKPPRPVEERRGRPCRAGRRRRRPTVPGRPGSPGAGESGCRGWTSAKARARVGMRSGLVTRRARAARPSGRPDPAPASTVSAAPGRRRPRLRREGSPWQPSWRLAARRARRIGDTPTNLSGVEGNTSGVTSGFTQERARREPAMQESRGAQRLHARGPGRTVPYI